MSQLTRYRINFSSHADTDPHTKKNTVYQGKERHVFDSDKDLLSLNTSADKPKFTVVDPKTKLKYDGAPGFVPEKKATTPTVAQVEPIPANDTLETMSLDELKKLAAEEEIPLGKAKTKEEIVALIRGTK